MDKLKTSLEKLCFFLLNTVTVSEILTPADCSPFSIDHRAVNAPSRPIFLCFAFSKNTQKWQQQKNVPGGFPVVRRKKNCTDHFGVLFRAFLLEVNVYANYTTLPIICAWTELHTFLFHATCSQNLCSQGTYA